MMKRRLIMAAMLAASVVFAGAGMTSCKKDEPEKKNDTKKPEPPKPDPDNGGGDDDPYATYAATYAPTNSPFGEKLTDAGLTTDEAEMATFGHPLRYFALNADKTATIMKVVKKKLVPTAHDFGLTWKLENNVITLSIDKNKLDQYDGADFFTTYAALYIAEGKCVYTVNGSMLISKFNFDTEVKFWGELQALFEKLAKEGKEKKDKGEPSPDPKNTWDQLLEIYQGNADFCKKIVEAATKAKKALTPKEGDGIDYVQGPLS